VAPPPPAICSSARCPGLLRPKTKSDQALACNRGGNSEPEMQRKNSVEGERGGGLRRSVGLDATLGLRGPTNVHFFTQLLGL